MSRTASLRDQHDRLLALSSEIDAATHRLESSDEGDTLWALLMAFDAVLIEHLTTEDHKLYPAMQAMGDRRTAALASRFAEEMGDLTDVYAVFKNRWNSPAAILGNAAAFRQNWTALVSALGFRIQRENAELYPLADALDETALDLTRPVDATKSEGLLR